MLPQLVNDLQKWKNGSMYTAYATKEECDRLQQLLRTKYQLEIPYTEIMDRRGVKDTIINYVLSQYSE